MYPITDKAFSHFQRFIYEAAGISLSPAKKALVCGRLAKRLQARGVASYDDYFSLLESGEDAGEIQMAIDLLTTNETYFFREPKHFEWLRKAATEATAQERAGQPYRAWSAACSSGEEAYSIAMVLMDVLQGRPFEVLGTDISTRVLQRARTGHYPETRTHHIPQDYLKRYCLKGRGPHAGTLLVDRSVRQHVTFIHANLNAPLPDIGLFDAVFLRNVMIYFDAATKQQVVARVAQRLRPGGLLFIGHSESLHGISAPLAAITPSVYRKS